MSSPDEPEDPKPEDPAGSARAEPDTVDADKAEAEAAPAKADKAAAEAAQAKAEDEAKAQAKADKAAAEAAQAKAEDEAKAKAKADKAAKEQAEDEAKAQAKADKAAKEQAEQEAKEKAEAEREAKEREAERLRVPSAPPWYRTLRADPPLVTRTLLGFGLVAVVIFVWWFLTRGTDVHMQFNGRTKELHFKILPSVHRIISAAKLPSPGEVFGSFDALMDRHLAKNATATLWRVVQGVGMAALVGILLGVLAAAHRGVNAAMAPLVIFLRSVPMGALIPLTLMLFGTEEPQKARFIFLALVPFVFSDTVKAISIVPDRYVETAQTLGASRWQIIRKVLVPLALPDIITSLRFQFGLGLGYIMLAEEINTEYGLGHMIFSSQREGPYEHVYLLLFVIALIAFSIDYLLRTIQRGVFAWRKDL